MADPVTRSAGSQTLSRGLRVLEVLANSASAMSIDQVAHALGLHRSVCYRLVRTLEDHGLVVRDQLGKLALGVRLVALGASVERDMRATALPLLTLAAQRLVMTCFLAIEDRGECLTVTSVEPPHQETVIAQRPGARHPIQDGATGRAILAIMDEACWPEGISDEVRANVHEIRQRGWAESYSQVIPGLYGVATPVRFEDGRLGSVGALSLFHATGEHLNRVLEGLRTVETGLVEAGVGTLR
ncbi:helix-turn-helix domain-containing protein [Auritidibacter ignavus]|uniref:IclR family transcriptional regulator n=1 Tax=Auritidibacter ignavus TaxID=678932 RepID=UPI002449C1AB|nr:helix-turn-helix domain-containing protein [Auritidibacter ignavus]WGH90371.1 helix-turn-helix domain-containing protein [Auritidibacter ignavus]